jgi:nucleoid DNA-binding protein
MSQHAQHCVIIESVACRVCKPIEYVEKEFGRFMDDMFCAVYTGHTVTIAGFGTFWPKGDKMRFSRITKRTSKPRLDVLNTAPDCLVYINNIIDDWPWHNTVRTKHLDGDPLYMSIFVEVNRQIYFKNAEFYLCCWNKPVFIITQEYSKFYDNDDFKEKMKFQSDQMKNKLQRLVL